MRLGLLSKAARQVGMVIPASVLDNVTSLLGNATVKLNSGDIQGASSLFSQAKLLVDQAEHYLERSS